MINPINFRANVAGVTVQKPATEDSPKAEIVTVPVENAASFRGADALSSYNKAFMAVDGDATKEAPAFKGEEVAQEPAKESPAFKGEEVAQEPAKEAPAFKGEEVNPEPEKVA